MRFAIAAPAIYVYIYETNIYVIISYIYYYITSSFGISTGAPNGYDHQNS